MPLTPRDLLGDAFMVATAKATVIARLADLQQPGAIKRLLYQQWARQVGVEVTDADLDQVAPSPFPR